MRTLLLDQKTWDLVRDTSGNLAVASDPYSLAQDAASAIRAFLGEVYYDTRQGVPYWKQILGKSPPLTLLKAKMVAAALTVPGVVRARCLISSWVGRRIQGQVQILDAAGAVLGTAGF